MILHAYLDAIADAKKFLPTGNDILKSYFQDRYNPRQQAIVYIVEKARMDVERLSAGELIEVIKAAREEKI